MQLASCDSCDGFVPVASTRCPNCDAAQPRTGRGLLARAGQALAGGAVAVTLMACYGAPAQHQLAPPPTVDPSCAEPGSVDPDGDGICEPAAASDPVPDPDTGAESDPAAEPSEDAPD